MATLQMRDELEVFRTELDSLTDSPRSLMSGTCLSRITTPGSSRRRRPVCSSPQQRLHHQAAHSPPIIQVLSALAPSPSSAFLPLNHEGVLAALVGEIVEHEATSGRPPSMDRRPGHPLVSGSSPAFILIPPSLLPPWSPLGLILLSAEYVQRITLGSKFYIVYCS